MNTKLRYIIVILALLLPKIVEVDFGPFVIDLFPERGCHPASDWPSKNSLPPPKLMLANLNFSAADWPMEARRLRF